MVVPTIRVRAEGFENVQRALRKAPELTRQELVKAYRADFDEWFGGMVLRFRGGVPLGTLPGPTLGLRRRTGDLLRSLGHRIESQASRMVIFSAGVPYAAAREFGVIVQPRRGKFITIPLRDNLTAAGVPRFPSARALMGTGRTFVLTLKDGRKFIVERTQGGALRFLWKLQTRAVQPGPSTTGTPSKFGFFDTWARNKPNRIKRHAAALRRALRRSVS